MRLLLAFLIFLYCSQQLFAHQIDTEQCTKETDNDKRLLCYDLLFRITVNRDEKLEIDSKWDVSSTVSKIDDSKNVYLRVRSIDTFQQRYKDPVKVTLHIQCRENTTYSYFNFGGAFMSDHNGSGTVTFRLDKSKAFNKNLIVSSNNEALGYWSGGKSIPFIRSMLGADQLLMRFAPYNDSFYTVVFPIAGLRKAVEPLAEACNWKL